MIEMEKAARDRYNKGVKHTQAGHYLSSGCRKAGEKLEDIVRKLFGMTDSDSDRDILKKTAKCMGGATVGYYALVVPHELSHMLVAELLRVKYEVIFGKDTPSILGMPAAPVMEITYESSALQGACISLAGPISEIVIGSWLLKKGVKEGNSFYTGFGLAGLVRPAALAIFAQSPDFYQVATYLLGNSSPLLVGSVLGLTYVTGYGLYKGLSKLKSYMKEKINSKSA